MNRTYLWSLVCFENTSLSIVDVRAQALSECFLAVYIQLPVYTALALSLGFALGRSSDMSRLVRHSTLTCLRLISTLLLFTVLAELVLNYFTTIYPPWPVDQPQFAAQLVLQSTRLVVFALNSFLVYNRNVFTRVYPVSLIVTWFACVLADSLEFLNRAFVASQRTTFDRMQVYEKIDILKLMFATSLQIVYFLVIIAAFKFPQIRVIKLDGDQRDRTAISYSTLLDGVAEEDSASYFNYLSFR